MDNPISFETKKDFIKGQMAEKIGPDAENYYEIQEMATPFADVARYVKQMTETNPSTNIRITHIAGEKDDDLTKLKPVLGAAERVAFEQAPGATIVAKVEGIPAAPTNTGNAAMSATKVRNDTYNAYLNAGFTQWPDEYKQFYGQMAEKIYDEILYPIKQLENQYIDRDQIESIIHDYISTGVLPKLGKKARRGGGRRTLKRRKHATRNKSKSNQNRKTHRRRSKRTKRNSRARK